LDSPMFDNAGNMYGTAELGGGNGGGIVWEISPSGIYTDLHDFGGTVMNAGGTTGKDGEFPSASVTFDHAGNMYGTAGFGGSTAIAGISSGDGMVWELVGVAAVSQPLPTPTISPGSESFSGSVMVSITDAVTLPIPTILYTTDGTDPNTSPTAQTYTGPFTLTATTTVNAIATASGSLNSPTATAVFTLLPPLTVQSLTLAPSTLVGGVPATGTVTLSAAPTVATTITITVANNNNLVTIPGTVVVQAGQNSVKFPINTKPVAAKATVPIKAALGASSQTAILTILPPLTVQSLTLAPSTLLGGASTIGTVTLNAVPTVDTTITVATNNNVVTILGPVVVQAGQNSVKFLILTKPVAKNMAATIRATLGPTFKTATLTILHQLAVQSLTFAPSTLISGAPATGTVTLDATANVATTITITVINNNKDVTVPGAVVVQAGKNSATFPIKTTQVAATVVVSIKATLGASSQTAKLTILPPLNVLSLTLPQPTLIGGAPTTGTVTLSAAPTVNTVITVTTNNNAATIPGAVVVLAGKKSATFAINTKTVVAKVAVQIKATLGVSSKTAILTILPPTVQSLILAPSTLIGGAQTKGIVT